jgi:hypothetical protein
MSACKEVFSLSSEISTCRFFDPKELRGIRAWKVEMRGLLDWLTLDDWQSAFPLSCSSAYLSHSAHVVATPAGVRFINPFTGSISTQ